jgi:hypothetical protein
MSAYQEPEIVWRVNKKQHAGLIVAFPDPVRIENLLDEYGRCCTQRESDGLIERSGRIYIVYLNCEPPAHYSKLLPSKPP